MKLLEKVILSSEAGSHHYADDIQLYLCFLDGVKETMEDLVCVWVQWKIGYK